MTAATTTSVSLKTCSPAPSVNDHESVMMVTSAVPPPMVQKRKVSPPTWTGAWVSSRRKLAAGSMVISMPTSLTDSRSSSAPDGVVNSMSM